MEMVPAKKAGASSRIIQDSGKVMSKLTSSRVSQEQSSTDPSFAHLELRSQNENAMEGRKARLALPHRMRFALALEQVPVQLWILCYHLIALR